MSKLLVTKQQMEKANDLFNESLGQVFNNRHFGRRAMNRLLNPRVAAKFQKRVKALLRDLAAPDHFVNEHQLTDLSYPDDYKYQRICPQIEHLADFFGLDGMYARLFAQDVVGKDMLRHPALKKAEGWFAVPNLFRFVEKFFPNEKDFAKQYCLAVEKMISILSSKNNTGYRNYFMGNLLPSFFRIDPYTMDALESIHQKQPWDIWVIPAQFGCKHKGESVNRVREIYLGNEFGLTSFFVANMLLTHPERLTGWDQLQLTCPGDQVRDGSHGSFMKATGFSCRIDEVNFLPIANSFSCKRSAPATGFLIR